MVVTLSIALMLGHAQWIWSPTTYRALPPLFNNDTLVVGSIRISYNDVTIWILALAVAIGLRLFLYRTRVGVTMRASVDDRTLTSLNGSSAVTNAATPGSSAHAGHAGRHPHRADPHPVGPCADPAHRQRLRGVGHRAPALHSDDLPGCDHFGPFHRLFSGLPAPEPLRPRDRECGAGDHLVHRAVGPACEKPARTPTAPESRARLPSHVERSGLLCAGTIVIAIFFATTVGKADMFSLNKTWGLAIVGLSIIPIVGYAGRLSLCQMTFAGIGATMVGHLGGTGNPLSLLAAAWYPRASASSSPSPPCGSQASTSPWPRRPSPPPWTTGCSSSRLQPLRETLRAVRLRDARLHPLPHRLAGAQDRESAVHCGVDAFSVLVLLVVAVRRSEFGQRLLAMKDSPAACATLGMNGRPANGAAALEAAAPGTRRVFPGRAGQTT